MLTIRPIGACRLVTPLKLASEAAGVRLDLQRYYGYAHTSAETLQALRFIRGEIKLPRRLLPLIAYVADNRGLTHRPVTQEPSVYVIEISSLKHLTVDGFSIQLNYTNHYFADFLSDRARHDRFFREARPEKLAERLSWLESESSFQSLSREDRDLLAAIELRMLGEDDIVRDLERFLAIVGHRRVVIQTHVDVLNAEGARIPARQKVIEVVKGAATRLGLALFDPTELVREAGQAFAMEKDGRDLTHFAPGFAERLGHVLIEDHLRSLAGDVVHEPRSAGGFWRGLRWLGRIGA